MYIIPKRKARLPAGLGDLCCNCPAPHLLLMGPAALCVGRDEGACLLGVGSFSPHCLFCGPEGIFARLKKFGLGYLSKPEYVLSSDLCSYLSSALFAGVVSFFGGVHGFRSPEGVFGLGWPPPLPNVCGPFILDSLVSLLFSSAIQSTPWGGGGIRDVRGSGCQPSGCRRGRCRRLISGGWRGHFVGFLPCWVLSAGKLLHSLYYQPRVLFRCFPRT